METVVVKTDPRHFWVLIIVEMVINWCLFVSIFGPLSYILIHKLVFHSFKRYWEEHSVLNVSDSAYIILGSPFCFQLGTLTYKLIPKSLTAAENVNVGEEINKECSTQQDKF